jgi:hypothetical protein
MPPGTTKFDSVRAVPAVAESPSVAAISPKRSGLMLKLSFEQLTLVGVVTGKLMRNRTFFQALASATEARVRRPLSLTENVTFGKTWTTGKVAQLPLVLSTSSTFTTPVNPVATAVPATATTSKEEAVPAILVLITPATAPAGVAVSKPLKLFTLDFTTNGELAGPDTAPSLTVIEVVWAVEIVVLKGVVDCPDVKLTGDA